MIEFIKIKTRKFLPPKDDFYNLLDEFLPPLQNGDVLIITSKVLAIHQGRCVKKGEGVEKDDLIMQEADYYIPRNESPENYLITIKNNLVIASAGIDGSNTNGYYVLWPEKLEILTKEIRAYLKRKYNLKDLAIIVADSHSNLLTLGASGMAIHFFGLEPIRSYKGEKDVFGRGIKIGKSDVVTPLASMGVLLMGEGDEQMPMVVARGADFLKFTEKETFSKFIVSPEKDIHGPMLKAFRKSCCKSASKALG